MVKLKNGNKAFLEIARFIYGLFLFMACFILNNSVFILTVKTEIATFVISVEKIAL